MKLTNPVRNYPRAAVLVALILMVVGTGGCKKLQARDLLNKGVAAFKNAQYDAAIEDFKKAKELDPDLVNARLYLATAYATQYIPGAPSAENVNRGLAAIQEYKDVLSNEKTKDNLNAIDGIGSILFQMSGSPYDPKKFEESKTYHKRHIELKPDDPEPYYWVGVIDWTLAFRGNAELRAAYNRDSTKKPVKDTEPLPAQLRQDYAAKYNDLIQEGLQSLEKAIQLRPDYDDAMAYLNLIYRRKADTVETEQEREQLLQRADALVDKVKEIKQRKLEKGPEQQSE